MRIRDWRSDVCSSGRDQRGGDVALNCVLRALRGEDAEAVLLADGLLLVLGELLEATDAVEDLPELVHDVDQRAPVDQFLETVQIDGASCRESVGRHVYIRVVRVSLKKKKDDKK